MRRFALPLGVALSLLASSAIAQSCDGFVDVLASNPFCPDVTWLATYGVTKGCDATHFCPTENVSRLQMAVFMHRLGANTAFVNGGNAFGGQATMGTSDNNGLVLVVDGQPAMSLQPAVDPTYGFNPNVVNGANVNSVAAGVAGATIAGGGGSGNQVTDEFGTVGGGSGNSAGAAATVAGGSSNTASGAFSTVAGGSSNTASGNFSTVVGGNLNTATDVLSFAAGNAAHATHYSSFVWSGWSGGGAPSFQPNRFHIGAENGLSVDACTQNGFGGGSCWVVIASGNEYPDQVITTSTGAFLSSGGVWANASDRALKSDFTAVDAQTVLAKVAQLPIDEWSYKAESGQRHLGPVAQDFYAAFGLGSDDRHITTVDESGVALAAIKGLYERTEAALQAKDREIASLRAEMNAIKAALNVR
jgi:hypothetical protein